VYKAFKSHQLISSASAFVKATLHIRDKLVFFQVPDESVIDDAYDYFTQPVILYYNLGELNVRDSGTCIQRNV